MWPASRVFEVPPRIIFTFVVVVVVLVVVAVVMTRKHS